MRAKSSDSGSPKAADRRPIVNGYGRAEPPGHADLVDIARGFPATAPALRDLGVQYVVVHGDRHADGAAALLAAARAHAGCRLAAQIGSDYLFELTSGP